MKMLWWPQDDTLDLDLSCSNSLTCSAERRCLDKSAPCNFRRFPQMVISGFGSVFGNWRVVFGCVKKADVSPSEMSADFGDFRSGTCQTPKVGWTGRDRKKIAEETIMKGIRPDMSADTFCKRPRYQNRTVFWWLSPHYRITCNPSTIWRCRRLKTFELYWYSNFNWISLLTEKLQNSSTGRWSL